MAPGPVQSPQLLSAGRLQVLAWRTAAEHGRLQLTSIEAASQRMINHRSFSQPDALMAYGEGRLMLAWRQSNHRGATKLKIGLLNPNLSGQETVTTVAGGDSLHASNPLDPGPKPQAFLYEPHLNRFLLVEAELRPAATPSATRLVNRPRILLRWLNRDGRQLSSASLPLPATNSYLDCQARVVELPDHSFALLVIERGSSIRSTVKPDALVLYHLSRDAQPLGQPQPVARSLGNGGAILDTAGAVRRRQLLVVWENEDPAIPYNGTKELYGRLVRLADLSASPQFLITNVIAAQDVTTIGLLAGELAGRYLVVWNAGSSLIYLRFKGDSAREREPAYPLFAVKHSLYMQPPSSTSFDPGTRMLTSLWVDPGNSININVKPDPTAKVYLSHKRIR